MVSQCMALYYQLGYGCCQTTTRQCFGQQTLYLSPSYFFIQLIHFYNVKLRNYNFG